MHTQVGASTYHGFAFSRRIPCYARLSHGSRDSQIVGRWSSALHRKRPNLCQNEEDRLWVLFHAVGGHIFDLLHLLYVLYLAAAHQDNPPLCSQFRTNQRRNVYRFRCSRLGNERKSQRRVRAAKEVLLVVLPLCCMTIRHARVLCGRKGG